MELWTKEVIVMKVKKNDVNNDLGMSGPNDVKNELSVENQDADEISG